MKRAYFPFEVKAVDATARTFEGYASTHELDLQGDIIEAGAYTRTLNAWRDSKTAVIPILKSHRYHTDDALGKVIEAEERDNGLWFKAYISETLDGDSYLTRIKDGVLNGLSIGYEIVQKENEEREVNGVTVTIRHLKEIKLREISIVLWGAQQGALIDVASVKAMLQAVGKKALEDDQIAELKALRAEIDALVEASKKTAGEEEAAAPERLQALEAHLLELRLASLPV